MGTTSLHTAASNMASPADRDKDSTSDGKQSKADNPFIKFRQFADTQISSLLQGIIGLPSAFSKGSSDDPRWAGVDDGLRRRDELQARRTDKGLTIVFSRQEVSIRPPSGAGF